MFNNLIIQKKALLLLNNSNTPNQKQHSEQIIVQNLTYKNPHSLITCKLFILRTLPTDFSRLSHSIFQPGYQQFFTLIQKPFTHFFSTINPKQVFHNTSFIMDIVDNRMKALHISNNGYYIDTRERFRIFRESKRTRGGENKINDQHKISFNKIPGVITQFTTTS